MVRIPDNASGTVAASTGSGQYRIELAPFPASCNTLTFGYKSVRVTHVWNPRSLSSFTTRPTGPPDPDPRSTISFTPSWLISFERQPAQSFGNGVIPYAAARYDVIADLREAGNQD